MFFRINARNYRKSPLYNKLRTVLGNGLLTSEGDFWLRHRRIAQPAFHRQRIAALAGVAGTFGHIARRGKATGLGTTQLPRSRCVALNDCLAIDCAVFAPVPSAARRPDEAGIGCQPSTSQPPIA